MIICSDVDGVILNYIQGFIDFTREENISYQYNPEVYGVITGIENAEHLRSQFHAKDYLCKLQYYEGALEVLNLLVEQHEVHLVTAIQPEYSEMRSENLSALNYSSLQCVGDAAKEQVIVEEVVPDVMIEDRPKLIRAFHSAGIPVFYPEWHQYTQGMDAFGTAFSHWNQLPDMLKKMKISNS